MPVTGQVTQKRSLGNLGIWCPYPHNSSLSCITARWMEMVGVNVGASGYVSKQEPEKAG